MVSCLTNTRTLSLALLYFTYFSAACFKNCCIALFPPFPFTEPTKPITFEAPKQPTHIVPLHQRRACCAAGILLSPVIASRLSQTTYMKTKSQKMAANLNIGGNIIRRKNIIQYDQRNFYASLYQLDRLLAF